MSALTAPIELVRHLATTFALSESEAARLVVEVVAYFDEPVEAFVTRRHRELQADGVPNAAAFAQIIDELATARFRAPPLTARQVRRIIYG